jgi:general secretion pathway protein D
MSASRQPLRTNEKSHHFMIRIFRVVPVVLLGILNPGAQAQEDDARKTAPAGPPVRAQPAPPPRAATPLPAAPLPAPAAPVTVTAPPVAVTPPPAPPGQPPAPALKPGEVLLNFQAADIQAVVKAVSQMTNRNFLLDPRVKGQITIISARPMTAGAAYQVFLSALKAQGFTAVEGFGAVRVIPTGEAKLSADVSAVEKPAGGEQIVTHVAAVQHVSATQLVPILRPLMAPTSQLSSYEPGNLLILTDYAENVRRMLRIIERVDLPATTEVTVVPLVHASALDLAELITRLASPPGAGQAGAPVQAAGIGGDRFSIVPDLRTNSLLIRTENPGRLTQMRSLIAKLDVPAKRVGNTRVIYLKNAEATKIAEVLRGLLAGEARAAQPAAAPGAAGVRPVSARSAEPSLIQADEATNSLIINASDAVYNNLRGVIEQLDVRRSQVFVEALIVEISTDKANELGFQWTGGREHHGGVIGAMTNYPAAKPGIIGAAAAPVTALGAAAGLTVAFLGEEITLPDGTRTRSLGGLARALESRDLGNVLSTPNLMTLDNAEAKIVVGQNVPFITGSFAQATGAAGAVVNPFQTIERKDVGLTLKIKPQISDGGTIRLDIYQEISSVAGTTTGASDLITRKRSVETKVVVDDSNTVVLGGLIEDTLQETQQAVPLLGSIPLLGALFRYKENVNKKTNLMVFLRPTIVRTAQDGFNVTVDRYNYLRAKGKDRDEEGNAILDRLAPVTPAAEPKTESKPTPEPSAPAAPANGAAPTPAEGPALLGPATTGE